VRRLHGGADRTRERRGASFAQAPHRERPHADVADLAGNGAHDSLAVWQREAGGFSKGRIEGRFVRRPGGLGRPHWLSNPGGHFDVRALLASGGRGMVAWLDGGRKSTLRFVHVHE
jgi:hypothetical protein